MATPTATAAIRFRAIVTVATRTTTKRSKAGIRQSAVRRDTSSRSRRRLHRSTSSNATITSVPAMTTRGSSAMRGPAKSANTRIVRAATVADSAVRPPAR